MNIHRRFNSNIVRSKCCMLWY